MLASMTPWLRKLGLSLHVALSVGWLGAVAAFLALTCAALSGEALTSAAAYSAMAVVGRAVLLPLSIGALVSGIAQSLGTRWGLFRHYWVLVKLGLTLLATAGLFIHQITAIAEAGKLAGAAVTPLLQSGRLRELGVQLLADSAVALGLLLTMTLIAVYKPWGTVAQATRGLKVFLASLVALLLAFIALHLSGHSPHRHSH